MRSELTGIDCVIRTKQLTVTCIHCVINVASEDIFNNVNVAMNQFNIQLFKLKHISSYIRQDIDKMIIGL